jgi:hypothetical protein
MTDKKQIYTARNCHKGPVMLFRHKGLELWGASVFEAKESFYNFDLVISLDHLTIPLKPTSVVEGMVSSIGLQRLIKHHSPEHLIITWPDMGVPKLDKSFWNELCKVLAKKGRDRNRYNRVYKVMIHCIGGHGRTGTALCILANKIAGWKGKDLIERVRRFHCGNAVESNKQIEYIEEIIGEKVEGKGTGIYYSNNSDNSIINLEDYSILNQNRDKVFRDIIKENENINNIDEFFINRTSDKKTEKLVEIDNRIINYIPLTERELEKKRKENHKKGKHDSYIREDSSCRICNP